MTRMMMMMIFSGCGRGFKVDGENRKCKVVIQAGRVREGNKTMADKSADS